MTTDHDVPTRENERGYYVHDVLTEVAAELADATAEAPGYHLIRAGQTFKHETSEGMLFTLEWPAEQLS